MSAAIEHCRKVISEHSKSFALASLLLPRDGRDDVAVVYAWCRHADDAVDLCSASTARQRIAELEEQLAAVYGGAQLNSETLLAFREVVQARAIPLAYPAALLRGMRMDVDEVRYASLQDLYTYCFRVAGTVGLMMCHVLGVRHPAALRHAADLGIAMQLTNICRDVLQDWQRGRLYLPGELLQAAGIPAAMTPERGPLREDVARRMQPVVRSLLESADDYYASGDAGLGYLSPRSAFSVRAARLVYSAIGERIAKRGYNVLAGRASLSGPAKLALCLQAGVQTLWAQTRNFQRFQRAELSDSVRHVVNVFPL